MKTYQITYEDGSTQIRKATDIGALVQDQSYFTVKKIEEISGHEIVKGVAEFNEIISWTFRSQYYSKTVGTQLIIDCLQDHEFNVAAFLLLDFPNDTGGHRNIEVGPKVYLNLLWHKMPSGNFEFICYLS